MEQDAKLGQSPPTKPTTKSWLLLAALGITFLTIALYLLFSQLANWLPETYGDTLLDWLKPPGDLPPEGIQLVQGIIIRILAVGFGLLLLHGLVKLFSGRRLYLTFGRITEQQRDVLAKNIIIYFVILIVQELLLSFLNLGHFVEGPAIQTVQIGLWGNLLLFFLVAAAGPVFEEALFRGFLYTRLRSVFKFWPAFIISGLFFSLLHFDPQGSTAFNAYNIFNSFVFSYFVTKVFEETNNLWNPIIFHGVYNGWLMMMLYVSSIIESLVVFT